MYKVDGKDRLGVHLFSEMGKEFNVWMCQVSTRFCLVNQNEDDRCIYKDYDFLFKSSDDYDNHGTRNLTDFYNIITPSKGFIKDNAIIIESRVTVKTENRFRKRIDFDLSLPSETSNTVLTVGEKKIHVCKEV
ncbi:hypothetical protein PFISCL1PPCAC_20263, partial [Pristionchus fissidentatus]